MANLDGASCPGLVQRCNTVFIDTSLDTHLAVLVSNVDTASDLKKRLLLEHTLCFPDVGEIKISALKVKRRGHFYHLSDSMFVKKAFDGISKNWFLFVEATRVEKESENRQLQQIDSNKQVKWLTSGVEPLLDGPFRRLPDTDESGHPLESDQHVKSKASVYLSGADKQQPNDFEMEAEHDATNHPDVPSPETHARLIENVAVYHQKDSAATNHDSLVPELLENEKDLAMNSELVDGNTSNEAKDLQDNSTLEGVLETEVSEKRKRKHKRKTRSSDDHALVGIHGPSRASALTSAANTLENASSNADNAPVNVVDSGNTEFVHPENAAADVIEPSGIGRENADIQEKSVEAGGDATQHKNDANVLENAKSLKEPSTQTPARKKRKTQKNRMVEDSVAGSAGSMLNTDKAGSKPEALNPHSSLEDRQKVSDLDIDKIASDHFEANSGLTASTIANKEKKRKKPSKELNKSAAATTSSRDLVERSFGVTAEQETDTAVTPAKVDNVGGVSESSAISPSEKLGVRLTVAVEKEIERDEENIDHVGSRNAMLNAADNLQGTNLASTPDPLVQELKKLDHIRHYTDQTTGLKDKQGTLPPEVANLEQERRFSTKDGCAVIANGDDGEINADEAKSAKSSKRKKKSKKAKNPVEGALFTSNAQQVEGSAAVVSLDEPIKPLDGEEPDSVIRNVLESLQRNENHESLGKTGKKSRKKTMKRQTLNEVDAQGLLVEENNAADKASMVSIDNINKPDDSSKPSKKAKRTKTSTPEQLNGSMSEFENDARVESDHFHAKQNMQVVDSSQQTVSLKLNGNNQGKPSNQIEPSHQKEVDVGDNFVSTRTEHKTVVNCKMHDQGANETIAAEVGVESNKKKKTRGLHPGGSVNDSRSSMKPNEKQGSSSKAQPASSSTSQQPSNLKKDGVLSLSDKDLQRSLQSGANVDELDENSKAANLDTLDASAARSHSKKTREAGVASNSSVAGFRESIQPNMAVRKKSNVDQLHASVKGVSMTEKKEVVKSSSALINKNKPKQREKSLLTIPGSIFKDDNNWNSDDDESANSGATTRTPSDASSEDSDEDSDATFKSPQNGSRVLHGKENGGRNTLSSGPKDMSLEKILRSSSRYKKAKITASQSQPDDYDDESLPFDCVPDSQAN